MFGKRARGDPLNMRAIKRYVKVDANRMRAYDRGELVKAMELEQQLATINAEMEAEEARRYPNNPCHQNRPPEGEREAEAE